MKKKNPTTKSNFFCLVDKVLSGEKKGIRNWKLFLGPAFIASIAYVDPGNFATNIQSGAEFGYKLAWVILIANFMGMFVQLLSAKLGVATGKNLAELCRDYFPKSLSYFLWIQAEIVAMATDLAEFVGASLGFYLLFGIPLWEAALITALISLFLLQLQKKGFRPLEIIITGLVAIIVLAFSLQTFYAKPNFAQLAKGLIPQFFGEKSIFLATAILGATVMPHVIFLHSALTQKRIIGDTHLKKKRLFRFQILDVCIAMGVAGLINLSMLVLAAAVFHERGLFSIQEIEPAFQALQEFLPKVAPYLFGIALVTSGLSSSLVGTMAGQVVMQGFVPFFIPVWVRRLVTILPSLIIIWLGISPTDAMIFSQVVLSFGIPFAIIPLVYFTQKEPLMGPLKNKAVTTILALMISLLVIGLNSYLVFTSF